MSGSGIDQAAARQFLNRAALLRRLSRGVGVVVLAAMALTYVRWQRPGVLLAAQVLNYVPCPEKVVALSFDDGPHPITTALLLDVLRHYHAHATFNVVGTKAEEAPDLLRRMVTDGDEVASHTYSHDNLDKLSPATIDREIADADRDIAAATGQHPRLVRPPGGEYDLNAMSAFVRMHRIFGLWSINPGDWEKPPPARIVDSVLSQVHPGAIILMHDDALNTIDALPAILEGLRRRGYRCVTMSDLELTYSL